MRQLIRSTALTFVLVFVSIHVAHAGGFGKGGRGGHTAPCGERHHIEIDQAKALAGGVTASDTPGFPVTIDRPGCYRLSGSLELPDPDPLRLELAGIQILSGSVSFDLGGFAITCGGTDCDGLTAVAAPDYIGFVHVFDGEIASLDPRGAGLDLDSIELPGPYNRVDRVDISGANGVWLGDDCVLSNTSWGGGQQGAGIGDRCRVVNVASNGSNLGPGLSAGDDVSVTGGEFSFTGWFGLRLGRNARVRDVHARRNDFFGIEVGEHSIVSNSEAIDNTGDHGIKAGAHSIVRNSKAIGNSGPGIDVGEHSFVRNSEAIGNFGHGIQIVSGRVYRNLAEENDSCGISVSGFARVIANRAISNEEPGLCASDATRYTRNVFEGNGYYEGVPEVLGGTEVGRNQCGDDFICP